MKFAIVLSLLTLSLVATSTATASHGERLKVNHQSVWIHKWNKADQSIWPAIDKAAWIFKADAGLLRTIVKREGGNINPRTLHRSLCFSTQPGWNVSGSYAFGPFQFMLNNKPACSGGWGTFSSYAGSAFKDAKHRGYSVPHRFLTPASNVGQAITAAYMIVNGGLHHWCASMC